MTLPLNLSKYFIVLSKTTTTYLVMLFIVPIILFFLLAFILKARYRKKNQIGAKGFFVSFLINYNVWFLLLLIFYALYTKQTNHIERNTNILNHKLVKIFFIITVLFDFAILMAWFIAPAKLNPNTWQWLWSIRESAIQSKYERERERKMKEYQEQMKQSQGSEGDTKKGKKKSKQVDDLLYRYLGLDTDCSTDEIKTAYRSLAKKYHPDTSTEENAVEMFMKIQKAYEVLNSPEKRSIYDQTGKY